MTVLHNWADEGLAAGILAVPGLDMDDVDGARAVVDSLIPPAEVLDDMRRQSQVEVVDLEVECSEGRVVIVRKYVPHGVTPIAPAVLYFHGGGFVCGRLENAEPWCLAAASSTGTIVFSVDYRLAPEHPYPAAVDDGWEALSWLVDRAGELGVDPNRIVVAGASAGGALAAATCLRARDLGGPGIVFQLLQYPVLDSDLNTDSMRSFVATPGWDSVNAAKSWKHYLRGVPEGQAVASYASPSREADLAGLPATYLSTCEMDPLRDEGIHYALALLAAGVSVELHQVAQTFHGFDAFSATSPTAAAEIARQHDAIRRAVC